jgi:hypothetical protein
MKNTGKGGFSGNTGAGSSFSGASGALAGYNDKRAGIRAGGRNYAWKPAFCLYEALPSAKRRSLPSLWILAFGLCAMFFLLLFIAAVEFPFWAGLYARLDFIAFDRLLPDCLQSVQIRGDETAALTPILYNMPGLSI